VSLSNLNLIKPFKRSSADAGKVEFNLVLLLIAASIARPELTELVLTLGVTPSHLWLKAHTKTIHHELAIVHASLADSSDFKLSLFDSELAHLAEVSKPLHLRGALIASTESIENPFSSLH
jgi:hypothetical protein